MTGRVLARCEQCGREGEREFRVIPAVLVDWRPCGVKPFWTEPITVCTAEKACRRRVSTPARATATAQSSTEPKGN